MLIKCFKKLSFRNSPFSSLSPHPVSWRPCAPQFQHTSRLWETLASLVAPSSSRYQSPFAERPAQGCCRLGPVPAALIPGTQISWGPGAGMGKFSCLGCSLPLRLDLFFLLKHRWLPPYSANRGTYPLPYCKPNSKQRSLRGSSLLLAERVCCKAGLCLQLGVSAQVSVWPQSAAGTELEAGSWKLC